MSELSLNTFLEEKKTRTRTNFGKKIWTREEDNYLLEFKKYAIHNEIAKFFGISSAAVQSRISKLVTNKPTKYQNPTASPKTIEEMENFLQFIKAKADSVYSKLFVTKKDEEETEEPENELRDSCDSEPTSTYQITLAEVISITKGEIIIGNYRIRGSFSLTVV